MTDPTLCETCNGSGLIETVTGMYLHETRCDADGCDDGIVR